MRAIIAALSASSLVTLAPALSQPALAPSREETTLVDQLGERISIEHAVDSGRFRKEWFHYGMGRGTIPSIDAPRMVGPEHPFHRRLPVETPVMGLTIGGEVRAYPIPILARHEVANDRVGGRPVAIAY